MSTLSSELTAGGKLGGVYWLNSRAGLLFATCFKGTQSREQSMESIEPHESLTIQPKSVLLICLDRTVQTQVEHRKCPVR